MKAKKKIKYITFVKDEHNQIHFPEDITHEDLKLLQESLVTVYFQAKRRNDSLECIVKEYYQLYHTKE